MRVGSLFSGIGGFDLGFQRAGMDTRWFCEQDEFCQRVLAKHWPGVPCYPDVTELRARDIEPVDLLCGGFPCQDISVAGKGAGIDGARSGLWSEFARLIGELRPRYVVVENVPALLARGMGRVVGDLAALGYDAEWDCLPASAFGAPHRRDRVWIVGYPASGGFVDSHPHDGEHPDAGRERESERETGIAGKADSGAKILADPELPRLEGPPGSGEQGEGRQAGFVASSHAQHGGQWEVEPALGRVADGFPGRVDQLRALGNALVPQIAEFIGGRLMALDESLNPVRF